MKTRNDFVSNSSSSSFIVISKNGRDETVTIRDKYSKEWMVLIPNKDAKHEFGWENEITESFMGKLNFVGIQLLYLLRMKLNKTMYPSGISMRRSKYADKFDEYFNLVRKVCLEKFDVKIGLDTRLLGISTFQGCGTTEIDGAYSHTVELDDSFYIDHQSNACENKCMEMFESEEAMYDFLKTPDSYVEGGNDNYD